jgi:polysaccharide biosynthesis transport protein
MAAQRDKTLNDYINIVKRRLVYVIAIFFIVFLASIVIALKKPSVYQSAGTILIESQQVRMGDEKKSYDIERFSTLKQVVLSNENLFKIADKYKLFGLDKTPKISPTGISAAMRTHTTVTLLKAEAQGWEPQRAFAFQVSCDYYKPDATYNMANDLIQLFLNENNRVSNAQVTETAEFFSKEADKRRLTLEKIENEISAYKQSHSNSLPENKEMQVTSLERLENDLRDNQREYSSTEAELRSLDVSIESAKAGVGLNATQDQNSSASELEKLKSELDRQSAIYSDDHPAIRALKRKIDALEKSSPPDGTSKPVTAKSAMVAKIQAQIDTANARLKSLDREEKSIRAKISQTEGGVMQSSQTEGALATLTRDYDAAKAAYAEIKIKQDNSKIEKNIEMDNKGERFVLIEAPVLPDKPISPNRLLIIAAGFFGAIASAIGFAIVMETLDKRVRGTDALAVILKMQPIATIPYITTATEQKRKKYLISYTLKRVAIAILFVLVFVHLFITPLDVLITKILEKF